MVHRPRYQDWSWPKGKAEPGEHILSAAVREVEEETGIPVALGAPLLTQRYRLGSGQTKEVYYWIGTPDLHAGPLRARRTVLRAPAREIDETKWAKPAKARRMLTRRGDKRLLDDLLSRLLEGTLETTTVLLLRHGKSVSRDAWKQQDGSRPLNRMGTAQSLDLVHLLSCYGVERLNSSSWARCEQTLAPYAAASSLGIHGDDTLTESAFEDDPQPGLARWRRTLETPGTPVVVCMHRPTQKGLLDIACEYSCAQVQRDLNQGELKTAEMAVLHVAHPNGKTRVISAERHRPIRIS